MDRETATCLSDRAASPGRNRATATIVLPCLNEARALPSVLGRLLAVTAEDQEIQWKILVSDNGSVDGSDEIARRFGVQVIRSSPRGYGAAVRAGMEAADTDWVVFLDADGTYLAEDAVRLARVGVLKDVDLVIGSRILGRITPGSMPILHRYVGTPLLTGLIRRVYGSQVTDCNSGIRCVRRESYFRWNLHCDGMEFASEMIIRAARSGASFCEVPVTLLRSPPGRRSHLRPFRDGLNHLKIVLGLVWLNPVPPALPDKN